MRRPLFTNPYNRKDITGQIERVTFYNEETGYAVLQVIAKGVRNTTTVVGKIPCPAAGEWIDAEGEWINDPKFGMQFKAERVRSSKPNTVEGIKKYLGSGLIPGIGPHFAEVLVKHFGPRVLEIIDNKPESLKEVPGIGPKRLEKILAAWEEQKSVREIIVFLHSNGVSTSRAFRIYKAYGKSAIARVRENPYCLARDVWGIGFNTADRIAQEMGIEKDSHLRARAGVEYVLNRLTTDGHCAYPREDLIEQASELLEISSERIDEAITYGITQKFLTLRRIDTQELVFLTPLDHAERDITEALLNLSRGKHPCPPVDLLSALSWLEKKLGFRLAPSQRTALESSLASKVTVITGGPGVGKTTLVNAIVKVLRAKKLNVQLCAPTGRAAKRMSETSGMEAKTIHRLLEYDPGTGDFKHHRKYPLEGDVFVVDEASMLDIVLANQLLQAIPLRAALLLVGDVDQLPSVGPGRFLADVIASEVLTVCHLNEVFRQSQTSNIITNAHKINHGIMPSWPRKRVASPSDSDFYFFSADDPKEAATEIVELVHSRIPKTFGLESFADIQVLTPMQKGDLGAVNLNKLLRDSLNPKGSRIEKYGREYSVGDKVMQITNNYEKVVFNGDIGRISNIAPEEKLLFVDFGGRIVEYEYKELDELVLSYAITIHKSQGSEYPCVVIPIHTQHYVMLQRNLLYTAITRGKKLVVMIGTERALSIAVDKSTPQYRLTTLRRRLQEG